jgi:hypothetical protein
MNQPVTTIQPFQQVTTQQICGFSIRVQQVTLFSGVTIAVNTYDQNNGLIGVQMVDITGSAYDAWGSDDTYITRYVAEKLGFTVALPEPVAPEPVAPESVEPESVEPEPVAPEPVEPEPVAPEPVAPEPVAPEPVAPEPVAPEPVEPEPVAPEPAAPEPASE